MVRFKITTVLVIGFLLAAYHSPTHAQKDLSALVKKVVPSVVVFNVFDERGKLKGVGTGFFVTEDGALVTNYHVIEGGMRAEVKLANGEVLPIEGIISEDREGDLVLLTLGVKGRSFPFLKLTDTKIEAGQAVVVIGSPFGLEGSVSDGIVSAVRNVSKLGKLIQITAPISKGSSGSPVLNMKGEVVGIATSYIKEGQSLNFAICVDRVSVLVSNRKARARKLDELVRAGEDNWLGSADGLFVLGTHNLVNGHYEQAISYLKRSLQKKPSDPDTHFVLGVANSLLGRHYESMEAFKQAIRIKPDDELFHVNLGSAYENLGRNYEAIAAFKQAIQINPNFALAHYCLGSTYDKLNLYDSAINSYKQSIQIKPDFVLAHFSLGLTYLSVGNRSMALEQYKILKELDVEKANKLFNLIYK